MKTDNIVKQKTLHKNRFEGLFLKIFLAAILCMMIPLGITSFTTIKSIYVNLKETTNENLQQLSNEKMNEVNSIIQNQISLSRSIAESPYIVEAVTKQYKSGKLDASENEKNTIISQ